jgi:hypothetical protein
MQPTISATWTIVPNVRFTYGATSTVIAVMQSYVFSIKTFLKTTMGYTVKGSCTAGTGAMDGVDRWTSAADVTPRNNGAAGSQAWVVLTNGDGMDICLSYNSSADDIFRIATSPGGVYVAAGTPNQQPTAIDEVFDVATTTWINATASLDRVWHHWGTPDKKMWRSAIFRDGVFQSAVGVERFVSSMLAPAVMVGPPSYKFFVTVPGYGTNCSINAYNSSSGGNARVHAADRDLTINLGGGAETYLLGASTTTFGSNSDKPPLQGGASSVMNPVCLATSTSGGEGKLGNRIDWWYVLTMGLAVAGDMIGASRLIMIGETMVWPWDGTSLPQVF